MALEREMETFRRELPNLLAERANIGKYALIFQDRVEEVLPDFQAALEAGYDRFGLEQFMVKQIVEREIPVFFSRNITPCRS
jgi:hypothetical protein